MGESVHVPVLLEEVITYLLPYQDGIIVDATVGEGGHSKHILERVKPRTLVAVDRDIEILSVARERLAGYENVVFIYGNYSKLPELLAKEGIERVDAVLMDLGISSYHLEDPERGFSFLEKGPLDMRLDRVGSSRTAYEILNEWSEKRLASIIKEYGEEPWARRIARRIVEMRKERPLKTTEDLVRAVKSAIPRKYWPKRIHVATRTFQAIRIAVNEELDHLKEALKAIVKLLNPGGRLIVISFHSLEDRIVKHSFRSFEKKGWGSVLTKKPLVPTEEEVERNPRARSAKMRVFEKSHEAE